MKLSRTLQKIIGIFLLISCLSGCIPAAIVVGATAGGAVIYDKRSMKTIAQDQESTERAGQLIKSSPELQTGTHIAISTFDHVMLLVGQTTTSEQRDIAYKLVSNVSNVSRVYNEITIQPPTSSWQRTHDAWITTKIRTEMLAKPGLHSTQIKVVTENGVVYLMGIMSPPQVDMAVNIARRVDGVQKVVKVFENNKD
jgi:osmotically-inducible protein OsmY